MTSSPPPDMKSGPQAPPLIAGHRLSCLIFGGLGLMVSLATDGASQTPKRNVAIPDSISCPTCTITVRTVAHLGSGDGPGSLEGLPASVHVDSRNRYWLMPGRGGPHVYDSAGRFLASVGRVGQGPGEFVGPCQLRLRGGDSVLIMDYGTRRATIVDPSLKVARSFPSNIWAADLIPYQGSIIGTGEQRTPEGAGLPLHVYDLSKPSTPLTRSFGPRRDNWQAARPSALNWRIATGVTHAFWTSDADDYRIVGWSAPGADVVEFTRRPEWFPARSDMLGGGSRTPPSPLMAGLIQDSEGLLWVASLSASRSWREAWSESMSGLSSGAGRSAGSGEIRATPSKSIQERRINLEVIDPVAARVVTRLIMEDNEYLRGLLPSRRAALYSEDSLGNPRLRIVQLSLTRR